MLEIKDLSFRVTGDDGKELEIIDHVNLSVADGEFVVVTGPNGGGKSTLARLVMGIEQPTSGQILFNGQDITHLSVTERARLGVGYAFQMPPRFKGLTVRKLLSLAYGDNLPEDLCCSYLTEVGLCSKDYLNRELDSSLSGGEMKRIEIASLMARAPQLAIFDEPEAGIDLWSFAMLVDTFKRMHDKGEHGIMIISHQERIMMLADRIVVIDHGKIRTDGTREQVLPSLLGEFACECDFRGNAK